MAPIKVPRTYKGKGRKRRPWASIQSVLKEIKNSEEKKPITAFDALFTRNIKVLKSQKTRKGYRDKENKSHAKQLQHKRALQTDLDTVNATISVQDTFLESTFDRILAGPLFQRPEPHDITHKSKEFSISSISTSGNQYGTISSASEPSFNNTLFPSSWKTRKKTGVLKRREKEKHFAPKPNPALKLKNHENDGSKNETLDLNPCLTSTPKGMSCKEKNRRSPFLSPIQHSVGRGHGKRATDEIIEEENNSYQSSALLAEPCVHTFNARRNISPEMCQFGPSCKTSSLLSVVVEGKASSSLYKFPVHKMESLDVTAGVMLTDSVNVIDVPSQLHSSKVDERIVSTTANSNQLHGVCSELGNLKESFTCKDQKFDSGKQLFVNDSGNGVSINGSFLSSSVHQCKNVDLRRQKNRESKCVEGALYKSDDSPVEFFGFPDVSSAQDLCENMGKDFVVSNLYFAGDSNQFSVISDVTEKCKINRNFSQSKSRNISVILFDSWDSVNDRKLKPTPESKVCDQNQVVKSGMLSSDSQRLLFADHTGKQCAQDSAVQNSKEGSCHINDPGSHPAQESSVLSRETGLLCSNVNVSRSLLLQESSVDADESHSNNGEYPAQDSAVYNTDLDELLCSSISKNNILPESSVLNSDTGKQSISVKSIKKQKLLRLQTSRRLSHQVVPNHVHLKSQLKSPSFCDLYHISPSKTASKCSSELMGTVPEEIEEFKLLSINEEPFVCVSDTFPARDTVLQRCCQLAPISFSEAFSASYWSTCKKIGEGVYGEVFFSEGQERSVLKVIPIEGDVLVNGAPQKMFEEILSEIVIATELSGLRNGTENRTCSFSEVKRCICVQGTYPEELVRLWEDYDNCKGSENDSPRMFKEDQLYIILVLAFGGCDLEAHFFTTAEQSCSVFIQTGCALAVAEQVLEFEHRDLHWGNVLVLPTAEKNVVFRLCGKEYSIPTKGVCVTIIDFTLSRMAYDGCSIYNDLSKDPELFTSEGDYQFEVYRLMQKHTLNNWHHFKPYTNLLWLHYLLDKMCSMVNYNCKSSRSHTQGMEMLEKLRGIVLTYRGAQDFVLSELV